MMVRRTASGKMHLKIPREYPRSRVRMKAAEKQREQRKKGRRDARVTRIIADPRRNAGSRTAATPSDLIASRSAARHTPARFKEHAPPESRVATVVHKSLSHQAFAPKFLTNQKFSIGFQLIAHGNSPGVQAIDRFCRLRRGSTGLSRFRSM